MNKKKLLNILTLNQSLIFSLIYSSLISAIILPLYCFGILDTILIPNFIDIITSTTIGVGSILIAVFTLFIGISFSDKAKNIMNKNKLNKSIPLSIIESLFIAFLTIIFILFSNHQITICIAIFLFTWFCCITAIIIRNIYYICKHKDDN